MQLHKLKGVSLCLFILVLLVSCADASPASNSAETQWSSDPAQNLPVTDLGGDQVIPRIVTQENGDFFVAWFSNLELSNYDVRMQKYDALGNAQWAENGRIISDNKSNTWISDYAFAKDRDGNLILIFQDIRSGDSNIYAYKIDPDGTMLWGEDGLQLTDTTGFSAPSPTTVTTPDHIAISWEADSEDGTELVVQKLTPDGDKVWGVDGLIVPGQESEGFVQGVIAPAGDDDLIIVYGIEKQAGSQVMSIYAQKLDGAGNSVWNGGEPILLHESVPFYIRPTLISDSANGAYVGWYTTELQGFVQHLDADGNLLMPEGGAPLVADTRNLQIAPRLQFDDQQNELYVFWRNTDENQRQRGLSGQKLTPTGDLLWGENGRDFVELSNADLFMVTPRLSGDNVVVLYAQSDIAEDAAPFGAQLKSIVVDTDGAWVGSDQPHILSSNLTDKSDLEVETIGTQEWVAVWSDGGVSSDAGKEIVMQLVILQR